MSVFVCKLNGKSSAYYSAFVTAFTNVLVLGFGNVYCLEVVSRIGSAVSAFTNVIVSDFRIVNANEYVFFNAACLTAFALGPVVFAVKSCLIEIMLFGFGLVAAFAFGPVNVVLVIYFKVVIYNVRLVSAFALKPVTVFVICNFKLMICKSCFVSAIASLPVLNEVVSVVVYVVFVSCFISALTFEPVTVFVVCNFKRVKCKVLLVSAFAFVNMVRCVECSCLKAMLSLAYCVSANAFLIVLSVVKACNNVMLFAFQSVAASASYPVTVNVVLVAKSAAEDFAYKATVITNVLMLCVGNVNGSEAVINFICYITAFTFLIMLFSVGSISKYVVVKLGRVSVLAFCVMAFIVVSYSY